MKKFLLLLLPFLFINCSNSEKTNKDIFSDDYGVIVESRITKVDTTIYQVINDGKTLWVKNCKHCHGEKGSGNGVKARLHPDLICPYNLTKESKSNEEVYYIILNGQNIMPSFKNKLKENEIWILVVHIKKFKKHKNI